MELNVTPWQIASAAAALLSALTGLLLVLGRVLINQFSRRLAERFDTLEAAREASTQHWNTQFLALEKCAAEEAREWQRIEREILLMKADLPVHYVRREDYIRNQSVIEAKIDGLALKIENALLRGRP